MRLKDRVVQKSGNPENYGTVVKIFKTKKGKAIRTCAILWDYDWPRHAFDRRAGRVLYYKPEDLKVVDTWSLGNKRGKR